MVSISVGFILQLVSMVFTAYGIAIAIYRLPVEQTFGGVASGVVLLVMLAIYAIAEISGLSFCKYFGLFFTYWGKGAYFILMAFLTMFDDALGYATFVILAVWGVANIIFQFIFKTPTKPFFCKNESALDTSNDDYFES